MTEKMNFDPNNVIFSARKSRSAEYSGLNPVEINRICRKIWDQGNALNEKYER